MSEAIKLFGKTIPLPDCDSDGDGEEALSGERQSNSKQPTSKEASDRNKTASTDNNPKTPTTDTESPEPKTHKPNDKQSDTTINPQDKPLKKPDKILPCPRCNSMDTKFCYYNNYNVSQPRHFCKNCQRYWTAGGTMRNVPVGAGRRKNKNPASQFRHVIAPDAPYPSVKPNGTLLTIGSVLKNQNLPPEMLKKNRENENNMIQNSRSYCPSQQLPFFAVPPWVPPPGVIPMPFYPAPPYWGCYPMQPRWVTPALNTSPSSLTLGKHSIRQSEEENEEEEERERRGSERSLWVPKTLRIDDPGEAAKSSIWATLGINREKCDFADGGGRKGSLFKAFHSKGDEKRDSASNSPLLQANPAALSRSRNFHESS